MEPRRLPALAYSRPDRLLPGWMDADAAALAGQLLTGVAGEELVVDHREILTSTARAVAAKLGELPLKTWMALVTLHVAFGSPRDGRGESTAGHLGRLIWGKQLGGDNTHRLISALLVLRDARLTIPGYDTVHGVPSKGVSLTGLLGSLHFDEAILAAFEGDHDLDRRAFGAVLGGKGPGTIAWELNPTYARALAGAELQRFDWSTVHQLRGVALALWLVFTSPRIPYRTQIEDAELEQVEVELTDAHCRALGVTAATDAARRRTFNDAGQRVCRADGAFVAFEAHGGRGVASFLRVVRTTRAIERIASQEGDPLEFSRAA